MAKYWTTITYRDGHSLVNKRIWYKNYGKYEDLPNVTKSPQTQKEYAAYWAKRKKGANNGI